MSQTLFRHNTEIGFFVSVLWFGSFLAGCGPQQAEEEMSRRSSNLKALAILYRQYATENEGYPPGNEAELKRFIQGQGFEQYDPGTITKVEDFFISPRDGQPYIVIYGNGGDKIPEMLAYERIGTETGRWVVSSMTTVAEVNEERLRQLIPLDHGLSP
ncbi:MAG: hypothetical protein CMJ62_17210 [Planctomycetaceae bacterium]|nr:hypothetical protein [Planctomycetaceae bacterium]